jgi:hypothetical protein
MKMKFTKKRYKLLLFIIFLIIIVVVVVLFISKINKPVTNSVSASIGSANSNYYNIDLTPVKQTGHYVSFDSPKGLALTSRSLISPISVEDFTFYVKDVYSWTMAIDIIKTPGGQLNQSSSYNLRKNDPSQYSETVQNFGSNQADVMADTSFSFGFSKVAYLTHGGLVGIISLIGNDTAGVKPLDTTFNMVLNSWQWL